MTRWIAWTTGGLLLLALIGSAGDVSQTDWSAGDDAAGPVNEWTAAFATAESVSWRAVPGQLSLASIPRIMPSRETVASGFDGALKVVAGDVNGDGANDVLAAAYYDERIDLWINLGGDPVRWSRHLVGPNIVQPVGIALADMNSDGRLDILAGAGESGLVYVWWNNGGQPEAWPRQVVATGFDGAHDVAAADIDGDGRLDIVGVAWEDDEVAWWRNGGGTPAVWSRHRIGSGFDYACNLALGDVDDDGDTDVVAAAWHDAEVAWWSNDGGDPVVWTRQTVATGFAGAHWVDLADVDMDGRLDVLGAAMDRGLIKWWRNGGGTPVVWSGRTITDSLPGAVSVEAADVDGDGHIDVLAAGWGRDGVAWWQNQGDGGTWRRHDVDRGFDEASSVHAADVNGDGAVDMLATSWALAELAWWQLGDFENEGVLTSSVLDTGESRTWQRCFVDAVRPERSRLVIEARSSNDAGQLGNWFAVGTDGSLAELESATRYLQYRVRMSSAEPAVSPHLFRIAFRWEDEFPAPRQPSGRADAP